MSSSLPTLDQLPTPALLVDIDVLERNLARMAERARRLGVGLRPHLKTHKCRQIARRQLRLGAVGLTVSTLYEAAVAADLGCTDITWAFPLIPSRLAEARRLAERVTLRLVVDSPEAIGLLESAGHPFSVLLKIDCGYHRAGVAAGSPRALELARTIAGSETLRFDGLLSHSGEAYRERSPAAHARVAEHERAAMVELAARLLAAGVPVPTVSVGSTPATVAARTLDGVTEARPGNYAFFDLTQVRLGSCRLSDCALTVLSTVVSCQPDAAHAVVDAGALALSKDAGVGAPETLGEVFADYRAARLDPALRLTSLSQEHARTSAPVAVGTRLRILPNHSCLAAACHDHYWVVRGDEVIDRWRVWRGR